MQYRVIPRAMSVTQTTQSGIVHHPCTSTIPSLAGIFSKIQSCKGFLGGTSGNVMPARARDRGSIPGPRRCPGGGHGSPLHYSCLKNPTGRGAWRAAVHGAAKSWTRLKRLRSPMWRRSLAFQHHSTLRLLCKKDAACPQGPHMANSSS